MRSIFDLNPKESARELCEEELDDLARMVEARRWGTLLGPRKVGRTSLIKVANVRLEQAGFKTVCVNLWWPGEPKAC